MAAIVIDGKAAAAKVKEKIRERAESLKTRGITPFLAVVLVGEDPGSLSYVKGKQKALSESGMEGKVIRLPETVPESELLALIAALNADEKVHGILVQLPLPAHISEDVVINVINPRKDVDCFHPENLGRLLLGQPCFLPCTAQGVLVLLEEIKFPVNGSHAVIVGRSNIAGKPMALLLARREYNATITLCHTGTENLAQHTRQADILIAAAGEPGLIKGHMIKKGAAVIDVGISRITVNGEAKLAGDVVFAEALETAGWITPVPGGTGPMTVAMLMQNVLHAAESQN